MPINPYRNESLIQMETYQIDSAHADALVEQVRAKWALLREKGYAGDYPVEVLRSGGSNGGLIKVVEIFKWHSRQAQIEVKNSPEYRAVCSNITNLAVGSPGQDIFTQAVRG